MYFRQMSDLSIRIQDAVEAAKRNGYSVATIAAACGVSRQAVYQWLNGETKKIDGDNLVELAEVSGYSSRWIATGKGSKTASITQDEATILRGFRLFGDDIRNYWLTVARMKIDEHEQQQKGKVA